MATGVKALEQTEKWLEQLVQLLSTDQPYESLRNRPLSQPLISDVDKFDRMHGSLTGLAVGDALGASVEFRPHAFLMENLVKDMQGGGTWGLQAGQWTDDTSMALCLAASLIVKGQSNSYDQFERYRRWYRNGYMSSTGKCFDIGKSTRDAIIEFEKRQRQARTDLEKQEKNRKSLSEEKTEAYFNQNPDLLLCGAESSAGNGSLMRLAPIPIFLSNSYDDVKKYTTKTTKLTHGDKRAVDACQFYAGLIWYALQGKSKEELLGTSFYRDTLKLNLHNEIRDVAEGSYKKKKGYEGGIRGKGFVVNSLEAALWAFYNDGDSFETGALLAVNLGDDTDTTAAIYGQLAGAVYSFKGIPDRWVSVLFEQKFITTIAQGLYLRGSRWNHYQTGSDWSDDNTQNRNQQSEGTAPNDSTDSVGARRNSSDQKPGGSNESNTDESTSNPPNASENLISDSSK